MADRVTFRAALAAVLAVCLALWAGTAAAGKEDRPKLIWGLSKTDSTHYRMRMGASLPTRWRASFGAEFGFRSTEEQERALAAGTQMPSPAFFTQLTTPKSFNFLGMEELGLSFRHEPERRIGQVGLSARRAWMFLWGMRGSVSDRLYLPYDLENPDNARWRLEHSVRIDSERTKSYISATSWQRERDPEHHLRLSAGQRLAGFSFTAVVEDFAALRPRHTLRVQRPIFRGIHLAASTTNLFHDNTTHSLTARYTVRW